MSWSVVSLATGFPGTAPPSSRSTGSLLLASDGNSKLLVHTRVHVPLCLLGPQSMKRQGPETFSKSGPSCPPPPAPPRDDDLRLGGWSCPHWGEQLPWGLGRVWTDLLEFPSQTSLDVGFPPPFFKAVVRVRLLTLKLLLSPTDLGELPWWLYHQNAAGIHSKVMVQVLPPTGGKLTVSKRREHFANKGLHSQSYGLSSSHVWLWELDHKEG